MMGPFAMTALAAFAQLPPAPAMDGSGAGWAGFLASSGVLGWLLFFHLPQKDKQLKEIMDAKDAQMAVKDGQQRELLQAKDAQIRELVERSSLAIKDVTVTYTEQSREMRKEFREALDAVLAASERQTAALAAAIKEEIEQIHCRQQPRP
jgi:hypothetical protein